MSDASAGKTIELVGNDYPYFAHLSGVRNGFDLRYKPVGPGESFRLVLEDLPFQACEFSLSNYTMMRDRGVEWMTAIPVFLNRSFRHGSLYVRTDSDLTHPSQLRGKTIGAREYTQTEAVWWRGTMIDEYDLHWRDVKWVAGTKQRFPPPDEAGVEPVDGDIEQMVIDGKLDAFLAPNTEDSKKPASERRLRPLFPDTEAEERGYFNRTGIFPLNHAVVIRDECLARHPDAPRPMFDAYSASKKRYYAEGGSLAPWGETWESDPAPFGLTKINREIVGTLFRYLHEQILVGRLHEIDDAFVPGAAEFAEDA